MGATRKLTVVITNQRFGEDIVEGYPMPVMPRTLTTRLRRYETCGELAFYSEVLLDPSSEQLCVTQGITLDEFDPARFMATVDPIKAENPYDITLTHVDGSKLQVHDDMDISGCTVAELEAAYAPLRDEHPMCNIKLELESPVIHQLLRHVTEICKVAANRDRIILFIWE